MELILVTGLTGTGKTQKSLELYEEKLAIGEKFVVINCDSRQVYKYCHLSANIESGIKKQYNSQIEAYYIEEVPHFLVDFIDPIKSYSVFNFVNDINLIIKNIPNLDGVILVGGTGLWANAIYRGDYEFFEYNHNFNLQITNLRKELESLSLKNLQITLKNKKYFENLNNSDKNNKIRLINLLQKSISLEKNWGKYVKTNFNFTKKTIFITESRISLESTEKIEKRLNSRVKSGLIEELEYLYQYLLPKNRMKELGMFYKIYDEYKKSKINFDKMIEMFMTAEIQYQKRQATWIKKYFNK
jgi:tRNA dimethylallyltransferase